MTIASGVKVILGYVEEVTHGTTPGSPTLKTVRATTRDVNQQTDVVRSEEVRASRQKSVVRHAFNQIVGSFGYELTRLDFDDFLSYAMAKAWVAVSTAGTPNLGADSGTSTFTRSAGSWITDGFRPGDWIVTTGFSNGGNNGTFRVTAVAATTITVVGTLVTETQGASKTLNLVGKRLDIGSVLKTVTLERQFTDIPLYEVFRGVAVNQFRMRIAPDSMVGGDFTLIGMSGTGMTGSSIAGAPPTADNGTTPYAAFDGSLFEGGSSIAVATSLDWTLNNNRTVEGVIGAKTSPDVFEGEAAITGSLSAFIENATLFNKFINETESSLWMRFNDVNGTDFMSLVFHRIKYLGGNKNPGQTGPVANDMPFEALENTTYGTAVSFQRSNT